jgi:hypothetical protein
MVVLSDGQRQVVVVLAKRPNLDFDRNRPRQSHSNGSLDERGAGRAQEDDSRAHRRRTDEWTGADPLSTLFPLPENSIRNRLTALKKDRTEYIRAKDVLDVYGSLMDEGECFLSFGEEGRKGGEGRGAEGDPTLDELARVVAPPPNRRRDYPSP